VVGVAPANHPKLFMSDENYIESIAQQERPVLPPLKVLAHVHMFPPMHNAGSETFLLNILRGLKQRGVECRVISSEATHSYDVDGIEVLKPPIYPDEERTFKASLYNWADVIITHLNCTMAAMHGACDAAKPLVHLVHNTEQLRFHRVRQNRAQLIIFNSRWVFDKYCEAGDCPTDPSIIVHPIIQPEEYRTTPGDRVTMVSLSETKGAGLFYEMVRRFKQLQFAGVVGAYATQEGPNGEALNGITDNFVPDGYPNLSIFAHTEKIKDIYGMTKVILMPSDYESYGRVAVEGCCSGIVSIVTPTAGLKEALGDAAIYVDRQRVDLWEQEIRRLYEDEGYYKEYSDRALALAASLEPEKELDRLATVFRVVARVGLSGAPGLTLEVLGEKKYLQMAKELGVFDPRNEPSNFRPPLGVDPMQRGNEAYIADRQIHLNSKGQVCERSDPDCVMLLVGPGGVVPRARAIELGLIKLTPPQDEPAPEAKMLKGPVEDKSFKGPVEDKGQVGQVVSMAPDSAGALVAGERKVA